MSRRGVAKRFLAGTGSDRSGEPPVLSVLTSLNELAQTVRSGFDQESAQQIARTAQTALTARAVSVTNDRDVLAFAGADYEAWLPAIEEQTSAVVGRHRVGRPTVYQLSTEEGEAEVAVSPIVSEGVVIGTIHVMTDVGSSRLAELAQFASLISSQLQLAELEQSRAYAAEAELKVLRAQISPHFVHNSLTAIAGLVNTNPETARELIVTFAEFLRATFRSQTDLTTVADELRLVEAYLELEQARFGNRFTVSLNIAPEALPVRLPVLSLQPLVENAIRHGLESRAEGGHLSIIAVNAGPEVTIAVADDGVGIDPQQLERALSGGDIDSHVGILAVDTRLRSTFGDEYGLTIDTGKNAGTEITIRLPKYHSA